MIVTVVDRRGMDGWEFTIRQIWIADTCPKCGGPRGKPERRRYCEDGEFYSVDNWTNPCGHVDYYRDVLAESEQQRSYYDDPIVQWDRMDALLGNLRLGTFPDSPPGLV